MKLWQMTIILHVLCGPPASIRAEEVHQVAEGGNVTVQRHFHFGGYKKIFCKNDCDKEENILVETESENGGCRGRYCIEFTYQGLVNRYKMIVNITNVTSTDSGRYQCVVTRPVVNGKYEFEIEVTENASLNPVFTLKPDPNVTLKPTDDPSLTLRTGVSMTTAQQSLTQSISYSASSGTTLLSVGLSLAAIVILIVSVLLIYFRTKKSKEPPVSVDHGQTPEAHTPYEEIRDNITFRPLEMSAVHASASKPTEDQTSDIYSLATAPRDQLQAEELSDNLTYSEVDFHNCNDLTVNSALQSQTETVPYSDVQAQTEDSHYSTVSLPQQ